MRALILFFVLSCSATAVHAADCQVPGLGRGGDWVKIQELTRAFRCIIAEIEALKQQQLQIRELEQRVVALERLVPVEYLNDNGVISVEPDRLIGKATIISRASPSGKPFSLPVAQEVIEELCTSSTCHIVLSLAVSGSFPVNNQEMFGVGPCGFRYDAESGDWDKAEGCSGGRLSGTDGDGQPASAKAGADVILEAEDACLLSDTELKSGPGQGASLFGRDRAKGLFLISVPERRPDLKLRFQCVLEVFRTGVL